MGLMVSGLIWMYMLKQRTGKVLYHPGHWMFVALGPSVVIGFVLEAVRWLYQSYTLHNLPEVFLALSFLMSQGIIVGVVVIAFYVSASRWRWFFASWLAFEIFELVGNLTFYIFARLTSAGIVSGILLVHQILYGLAGICVVTTFAMAIISDWRSKTGRDWLHACGIATFFLWYAVITILSYIEYVFFVSSLGN